MQQRDNPRIEPVLQQLSEVPDRAWFAALGLGVFGLVAAGLALQQLVKIAPCPLSIAVRIKGRTEVAVVYDPMRNELFTATRGQGAQLNGYRLRCSNARDLDGTILATGFPFKAKQHATTYMNILGKLFTECADFRRTGSAALDLAYVAAGRVDGYFEIALKPWDFAAGELIAREAGAIVCDFTGGHNYMLTGNIVAGNPRVVKAMLANMREQLSDALKR